MVHVLNGCSACTFYQIVYRGKLGYEDDVIGEWSITPAQLPAGAPVVLRGVTGYAVAWNTSFGGVPAAEVVIGDTDRLLE